MAKAWSKKLQCPLDEDADYDNTFVRPLQGPIPSSRSLRQPVVQSGSDPNASRQEDMDMARLCRVLGHCRLVICLQYNDHLA